MTTGSDNFCIALFFFKMVFSLTTKMPKNKEKFLKYFQNIMKVLEIYGNIFLCETQKSVFREVM